MSLSGLDNIRKFIMPNGDEYEVDTELYEVFTSSYLDNSIAGGLQTIPIQSIGDNIILVLDYVGFRYTGTVPARILFEFNDGFYDMEFGAQNNPVTGDRYFFNVAIIIPPSTDVKIILNNATAGNSIETWLYGRVYHTLGY